MSDPDSAIPLTATLSVSRKGGLDCEKIAAALGNAGILSRVTQNVSHLPHKENGCQITMDCSQKSVITDAWRVLQNPFGFTCAHISIHGSFQGCIYDYLRPSTCPGTFDPRL